MLALYSHKKSKLDVGQFGPLGNTFLVLQTLATGYPLYIKPGDKRADAQVTSGLPGYSGRI